MHSSESPKPTPSSRALAPHARVASVADLSDDLLAELCTFLPPTDIVSLSTTCRRLNSIGKDPVLWSELVKRDFRAPLQLRDPTIGAILTSVRSLSRKVPSGAAVPRNNAVELASPGKSPGARPPAVRWFSSKKLAGAESPGSAQGAVTAYKKYTQLYAKHQAFNAAQQDVAEQSAVDLRMAQRRLRLRQFLDCCQFGIGIGCLPWLIALWLLLLLLRTGEIAPSLPWVAVWVSDVCSTELEAVACACARSRYLSIRFPHL